MLTMAILLASVAGCAAFGHCDCDRGDKLKVEQKSGLSHQRVILNEGYSELYRDVSHIDYAEYILDVKLESDSVDQVVSGVSGYAAHVKNDLERLAKDYPALKIDMDPLPEMEKRKRFAIGEDRVKEFAPFVGKGGVEFERTVLIALLGGINHERHMCKVLAKEEPDPGLKKFLLDTEQHFDAWYERIDQLLNRDYFRQPKPARH
jgi:hypothetical protein